MATSDTLLIRGSLSPISSAIHMSLGSEPASDTLTTLGATVRRLDGAGIDRGR